MCRKFRKIVFEFVSLSYRILLSWYVKLEFVDTDMNSRWGYVKSVSFWCSRRHSFPMFNYFLILDVLQLWILNTLNYFSIWRVVQTNWISILITSRGTACAWAWENLCNWWLKYVFARVNRLVAAPRRWWLDESNQISTRNNTLLYLFTCQSSFTGSTW